MYINGMWHLHAAMFSLTNKIGKRSGTVDIVAGFVGHTVHLYL